MVSSISADDISNHIHHIISCDGGSAVCEGCGLVISQIYEYESNSTNDNICFGRLLNKYSKNFSIHESLILISSVISKLELSRFKFKRSLYLFQEAIKKTDFKKGTPIIYALNRIFYSCREANHLISSDTLLAFHYGGMKPGLLKNFYHVYNDLTKELGLKKIFLKPEDFLLILFDKFKQCKESKDTVYFLLSKAMKYLPYEKRMNKAIAAGVFYIGLKMNNFNITQEEIGWGLQISRCTVHDYAKNIKKILSSLYFKNKVKKINNRDLFELKEFLKKKEKINE